MKQNAADDEIKLAIARIFASMCKNSFKRAKIVFNEIQADVIAAMISDKKEAISTAASLIVQNMIYSLTDLENKRKIKKQINEVYEFSKNIFFLSFFAYPIGSLIYFLVLSPRGTRIHRRNISKHYNAHYGTEMFRLWSRQLYRFVFEVCGPRSRLWLDIKIHCVRFA